jgi:cytidyltransferase-like protein
MMIVTSKIKLKKIIESARKSGKSILIKKGVFDIIHPGHVFAIDMFKKQADMVIILVQSDEFTKKKKRYNRPINNQKQRTEVVDGIKGVDYTYADSSNSREDYIKFLEYLKPTILAVTSIDSKKTKDYSSSFWKLKEFPDKKKPGFSTTEIINRVLDKCRT